MTREQAESAILEHLLAIDKIRREYYDKDDYLSLCIDRDALRMNNTYWLHPDDGVIDRWFWRDEQGE